MYIPCFDVGGDFYDFLRIDDNRIVVAISDVIGKGIPAALRMSCFRGSVRAYADTECSGEAIKEMINRLNRMVCRECEEGEFITLFYAMIDTRDMAITYCNCGHEPTVLIRKGEIAELNKGGLVLGVQSEAQYEIETVALREDDCLLFCTDGLFDAADFDGELWGRERMLETAKKFGCDSAEQMVRNILMYRRRFVGLASQIDDTSIIVVKVDETAGSELKK
jgi:sigma-B regulation protein RsbU (phosphoserine phosphatase)